jgi:hypothetical protein
MKWPWSGEGHSTKAKEGLYLKELAAHRVYSDSMMMLHNDLGLILQRLDALIEEAKRGRTP